MLWNSKQQVPAMARDDDDVSCSDGRGDSRYCLVRDWPGVWRTSSHAADAAARGAGYRWSSDVTRFAGGNCGRSFRSGGGDMDAQANTFSGRDIVVCRDLRIILRQLFGSYCGTTRLD